MTLMEVDASASSKDLLQKQDTFLQVLNTEKQLLALIHTKGLLHKDVQDLYRKVRTGYESIILNDHEVVELQEVEHCLWKLHYKHIDEFRKIIRQKSTSVGSTKGGTPRVDTEAHRIISRHFEGLKEFLSEAAEFYENLIIRFRKICGLPGEVFICKNGGSPISVEPRTLSKSQFACLRFLICLGDLARYVELCKKQDSCKWSVAFSYYLEANRICPDSGNPHNQLALLATYVNDSFLALYHCTRSLAVKEPFPDAWDNLMLLFDESRSSHVPTVSSEEQLDFLKPSERISLNSTSRSGDGSSENNNLESKNNLPPTSTELWPLFVRLISFFLGTTSLEEFPCTLSSIVKHLEALVQLDDEQLITALESYKLMDSSRRGPYRAVQLVTVFIFILHCLSRDLQEEKLNGKDQEQQSKLIHLALIAAFICIARLVERCVQGNQLEKCPILPAVMVFVEWLAKTLGMLEAYATDEMVSSAMSYFFDALTDLVNRLDISEAEMALDNYALWEDHELRGFEPMVHTHLSLDFTTHWEWIENIDCKRSQRIFHAVMTIVNRSNNEGQWICFDRKGMKFYTKEPHEEHNENAKIEKKDSRGEGQPQDCQKSLPTSSEEEEVILFKPITRHNSEPLYKFIKKEDNAVEEVKETSISADECLRRATSMLVGQDQSRSDPLSLLSDATNVRYNKPLKQQDALLKDSYPAGPPSFKAWVFDTEHSNYELENGKNLDKHELRSPIQEVAVESLASLLIDNMKDSFADSVSVSTTAQNTPPTYVAPVPSAPLLPDDAIWFRGNSPRSFEYNSAEGSTEANGILGAPPTSVYTSSAAPHVPLDFHPALPGLVHGYPPLLGMSSSEWLYHYRNNHKLEQSNTHFWPINLNASGPLSGFHTSDISRFELFNQWGSPLVPAPAFYMEGPQLLPVSPLVYGADDRRTTDDLLTFQRPSTFGFGAVGDTRAQQQPLLQYLKEKEWQLHSPQLRGSTFMGN